MKKRVFDTTEREIEQLKLQLKAQADQIDYLQREVHGLKLTLVTQENAFDMIRGEVARTVGTALRTIETKIKR